MFERFKSKTVAGAGVALLATLGIGGAAVAQSSKPVTAKGVSTPAAASQAKETPGQESTGPENSATDTDNVQSGDQSGTDAPDAADKAGTEGPETADPAGAEAPGSEKAGDDGPGGHADEPSNPNATTGQQGQN
jgi:hypothetical protein